MFFTDDVRAGSLKRQLSTQWFRVVVKGEKPFVPEVLTQGDKNYILRMDKYRWKLMDFSKWVVGCPLSAEEGEKCNASTCWRMTSLGHYAVSDVVYRGEPLTQEVLDWYREAQEFFYSSHGN